MSAAHARVEKPPYSIATDPALLDLRMVTDYLARSTLVRPEGHMEIMRRGIYLERKKSP